METYYRKHRGWDGSIYYARMSDRETEERRKIGLVLTVILMPPIMVLFFAFCAGLIKFC